MFTVFFLCHRFIDQNLNRCKLGNLVHHLSKPVYFRCIEISCRNIRKRDTISFSTVYAHQIIILRLIETVRTHIRTRCYNPDDLTFDNSFGGLWIFYLLADRNFISLLYQTVHVILIRMVWDSAHRSTFFHTAILTGQSNL